LKFEYLQKFEPELENVLGYELGVHMGSIHEKTRGQKSRATVPLKVPKLQSDTVRVFSDNELTLYRKMSLV
jgi:hypothetical protein